MRLELDVVLEATLSPPARRPPRARARLRATRSLQKQNATAISAVGRPRKNRNRQYWETADKMGGNDSPRCPREQARWQSDDAKT